MQILNERKFNKKTAVVIGKFDGVHKGHQQLLSFACGMGTARGAVPVAYTFESTGESILSNSSKLELLSAHGMEAVYIQPFTEEFRQTSPEDFVSILKNDFNAEHVIVGFNFRFGKDRAGDAHMMAKLCHGLGMACTIASPVLYNGEAVSSTRIRSEIRNGNMEAASAMLGRDFFVTSTVSQGKRLGRGLGFPTANIIADSLSLLPKKGVYASWVEIDGMKHCSVTNVGHNPTVSNSGKTMIETHIINYSGDIYGKELAVHFARFLRDEQKFSSLDELKNQIKLDTKNAVNIITG